MLKHKLTPFQVEEKAIQVEEKAIQVYKKAIQVEEKATIANQVENKYNKITP